MQISVEQLQVEAGQMALEIRLKDRAIAQLQAENASLKQQVEELTTPPADDDSGKRSKG